MLLRRDLDDNLEVADFASCSDRLGNSDPHYAIQFENPRDIAYLQILDRLNVARITLTCRP